jgi:hypothetical protein
VTETVVGPRELPDARIPGPFCFYFSLKNIEALRVVMSTCIRRGLQLWPSET